LQGGSCRWNSANAEAAYTDRLESHDHRKAQAAEWLIAGEAWQDHSLVFCHPDGRQYTRDDLNWRFGKMTRRAGIGRWHATKRGIPLCR
jgi:hypothetical protein